MQNGYGEPVQEESSIQLGELFSILYRNKLIIAVVTLLVGLATLLWIGTRTPVYQAQATLLLEEDEAAGGVLAELATLTSDPSAEAEIALIKSRSLAAVTAAPPAVFAPLSALFDATAPDFDPFAVASPSLSAGSRGMRAGSDPSAMDNLGLAWRVDRHDLRPFAAMYSRLMGQDLPTHRLRASIEPLEGALERPKALDVIFSADGSQVTITPHGGYLFADAGEDQPRAFRAGEPLDAHGWQLVLFPGGDFAGARYRVQRITDEDAVNYLLSTVTAVESGRKTNVVLVRVEDSDPYRAAEAANAICKNYIRRSVRIGQQKATQTVRFIDGQLSQQLEALAEAEREVVELQTARPETIAISTSATAFIEQLSALELAITQADLSQRVVAEALELLEGGDYEALARLGGDLPNLLALGYIKELGTLEVESLRLDRSDVLGYKALLVGERQRLQSLMESNDLRLALLTSGLTGLEAGQAGAVAQVASVGPEFQSYLTELSRIEAELATALGSGTRSNPIVRSLEGARSELMKSLVDQVRSAADAAAAASANYAELIGVYTESIAEWPEAERATIDGAVERLRERVAKTLASQAAGLIDSIAVLEEQKQDIEARLGRLPASELALAEPLRQRETRAKIVEFLLTSQQEATITAAATSAAAVLIDPAIPPRSRIFPQASMFLVLGFLVGFLLGCGAALLHNQLRGALYTEAEVERYSGLSVVGSVPNYLVGRTKIKGAKKGIRFLPMRDEPEGPQAEAYRQIRAHLRLAMTGDENLRTLAVTSCVPGEGKTVTNADLAMVFASSGTRVLLIDCDLRKPQVHNIFDVERGPGFGEVLEGHADWRDCVHMNLANGVDVIPAGRCEARPGELLASDRGAPIIDELLEQYDLVVFDLPPAVVVADVANFANKLDAVLLLYRSGGVPGRLLQGAANRLRKAGVNLVGVIVNAVIVRATPGGYGYGGYSYEYTESSKR